MWNPIDTHADVGIDVSYEIVTVFHETLDERGAVDLVYLVMHVSRSRRAV
jgi:hypothetical protein